MKVDSIDVEAAIKTARQLIAGEAGLSPGLLAALEVLLMPVQIMAGRLSLNSKNSSRPPSSDGFDKQGKRHGTDPKKKPGSQPGRIGTT